MKKSKAIIIFVIYCLSFILNRQENLGVKASAIRDNSCPISLPNVNKGMVTKGSYQETSPELHFSGKWKYILDKNAIGCGYAVSNTPGSSVQFTFYGKNLILYRTVSSDGGEHKLIIDGKNAGKIDLSFVEKRYQVPMVFDNLGEGIHTVELIVSTTGRLYIDAFKLPSPYHPPPEAFAALERVNYYRKVTGVPPVEINQALQLTSQNHAEFLANHINDPRIQGLGFHAEYRNLTGYTGGDVYDRVEYHGFTGEVSEVGRRSSDPSSVDPAAIIDEWMATVYHRIPVINPLHNMMGYGFAISSGRIDVLNLGSSFDPQIFKRIYTYPRDGQVYVPTYWDGNEIPDPLPGKPKPVGYPVSLHTFPDHDLVNITDAELVDSNNKPVDIYTIHHQVQSVFLIAKSPLKTNTVYTARVKGSIHFGYEAAFDHKWTFKTSP